jgi:hypothetical protein
MLLQIFCGRAPPPPQPTGDVVAAAATTPVDFEAMVAEQKGCPEMQCLHGGSFLTIAFS